MFLSSKSPLEYWIEIRAWELPCTFCRFSFPKRIAYKGISVFMIGCPCDVFAVDYPLASCMLVTSVQINSKWILEAFLNDLVSQFDIVVNSFTWLCICTSHRHGVNSLVSHGDKVSELKFKWRPVFNRVLRVYRLLSRRQRNNYESVSYLIHVLTPCLFSFVFVSAATLAVECFLEPLFTKWEIMG